MKQLEKYLYTFKNSWQYELEYKFNVFVQILASMISLISVFYLWNDVYSQKSLLMGYSKIEITTYYVIVGYLFFFLYVDAPIDIEIREGSLSIYLTKPISYLWHHYFISLSKALFKMLLGLPILMLVFVVFKNNLYFVVDFKSYLILFLTCFGAFNILFLFDVILSFLEFWIFQSESIRMMSDTIITFFAGTLIPIFFLPNYIQIIGNFLPFKYVGFFIIDSFLGKNTLEQIFFGIGVQFFWILVLVLFVKILFYFGLKKYEAVGN